MSDIDISRKMCAEVVNYTGWHGIEKCRELILALRAALDAAEAAIRKPRGTEMTDAPETIWAWQWQGVSGREGQWRVSKATARDGSIEYRRVDLPVRVPTSYFGDTSAGALKIWPRK